MKNRIEIGVIADDFTGASDAASFLRAGGLSVILYSGIPEQDAVTDAQAVVIALKTRSVPTGDAVRESLEAARRLKQMGVQQFYFKYCSTFDSTPAGNIGPVCDALMEFLRVPYTVLCPSLPVNGRTVKDGHLYVDGIPLHESHMRHHPLNPMWDDRIKELMRTQSRYPVCLPQDDPDLNKRMYLVPDYVTDEDGAKIAETYGSLPLLTGGSGLLKHLAKLYSRNENAYEYTYEKPGKAIVLAGSCSIMTRRQIAEYIQSGHRAVQIKADELLAGRQNMTSLCRIMDEAEDDILFYTSDSPENIAKYDIPAGTDLSALFEGTLAKLAVYALKSGRTRIITAGGETSGAVTEALGFQSFYIDDSIAPGVPVMVPCENTSVRLVLKSGNFGREDFFLKALQMTGEE
ncbi:MAG: four-carbon acid sugar kinase family protein [Solobacterium sp.]|nr:four-carbon acid sugar kinase family protein [Solobacterium sp.]